VSFGAVVSFLLSVLDPGVLQRKVSLGVRRRKGTPSRLGARLGERALVRHTQFGACMLFTALSIVPVGGSCEVPHTMMPAVDKTMR